VYFVYMSHCTCVSSSFFFSQARTYVIYNTLRELGNSVQRKIHFDYGKNLRLCQSPITYIVTEEQRCRMFRWMRNKKTLRTSRAHRRRLISALVNSIFLFFCVDLHSYSYDLQKGESPTRAEHSKLYSRVSLNLASLIFAFLYTYFTDVSCSFI